MTDPDPGELAVAAAIRDACIAAAKDAYETAGISGLCAEGRWENALGAIETLDLGAALKKTDII